MTKPRILGLSSALSIVALLAASGCASGPRFSRPMIESLGSGALVGQLRAFDGRTGREISLADAAGVALRADVVLFGEEHNDFVCNQLEAQLFGTLAADRPASLAMEFFETDTQTALDAYLAGKLAEKDFVTAARQKKPYRRSHRPLIEICRELNLPVIAANAPRDLVRKFRQSDDEYPAFLATLSTEQRAWMPAKFSLPEGAYFERFKAVMGDHGAAPTTSPASQPDSQPTTQPTTQPESQPSAPVEISTHADSQPAADPTPVPSPDSAPSSQPEPATTAPSSSPATAPTSSPPPTVASMFKAQSLWDDSMAEAIANHRLRFGDRRVMLIVGVFHVERDGGTKMKLRQRRPGDRIATIAYRSVEDIAADFDADDRGAADVVIYGLKTD